MSRCIPNFSFHSKKLYTMAPGTRARTRSASQAQQQDEQQGNLESVLSSYDHSHNKTDNQPMSQQSLKINIPGKSNNNDSNPQRDGDEDMTTEDRERSLTFGSFDLNYVMGKERGLSISGLLTPLGEPSNSAVQQQPQQQQTHQHIQLPARLRGDSTASISQFLHGIYPQPITSTQQHPTQQTTATRAQASQMVAHTPPTQMGTSYENSHFGKRMRAGVSYYFE